jgi:c-di-GMP-binding flagellar brake protein YcgR
LKPGRLEPGARRLLEQRKRSRYKASWAAKLKGIDPEGAIFEEEGTLENISAGGALVRLEKAIPIGSRLEISIKLPFKKWMVLGGEVIRIETSATNIKVALKFEGRWPTFISEP